MYFENKHSGKSSKIGHHFRKKSVSKLEVIKKHLLKKIKESKERFFYSINFWRRKFTWKVRFWHILTTRHYDNSQNNIISFEDIYFWPKTFLILYPSVENSTTHITIMHRVKFTTSFLQFAFGFFCFIFISPRSIANCREWRIRSRQIRMRSKKWSWIPIFLFGTTLCQR